jgi:hypothetical protein
VAVGVALAQPYLRVIDDHPEAERTVEEVRGYSPPVWGFVSAPEQSLVWGAATEPVRDGLKYPVEQSLFPGIGILALAGLGAAGTRPRRLSASPLPRSLRVGLIAGAGALAFLSLGLWPLGGWLGYRPLYELAPGWDALRTPGRLMTFTTLALAILAAAGAQRLIARAPRKRAAGAVLAALLLLEGFGSVDHPTVPEVPPAQRHAADPILHLPSNRHIESRYMFWSTDGFPRVVNGHSGFEPRQLVALREGLRSFPDERSAARLRALGVRTVLVHRGRGQIEVHAIAP